MLDQKRVGALAAREERRLSGAPGLGVSIVALHPDLSTMSEGSRKV